MEPNSRLVFLSVFTTAPFATGQYCTDVGLLGGDSNSLNHLQNGRVLKGTPLLVPRSVSRFAAHLSYAALREGGHQATFQATIRPCQTYLQSP